MDSYRQFLGFRLDNRIYYFPLDYVQEVIKPVKSTKVPFTPDYVLGVFNLKGNILPLVDVKKKLFLTETKIDDDSRIIILDKDGYKFGILVDKLGDILRLESLNDTDIDILDINKLLIE